MKKLLVFALLINSYTVLGQDALKPGFEMLEKGQFAEGANFFRNFLSTKDSTNRTAWLCYGRGIGLSGNPTQALQIFQRLQTQYPADFEISLNAAEALMWAGNYEEAKKAYEKLLLRNAGSFPANLGYANALSSLKDYSNALEWLDKALALQPANPNALISRKYALLGQADHYVKNQKYVNAAPLLAEIFDIFPDDPDALYAKAQLQVQTKRYEDAEATYQRMIATAPQKTLAYVGLSYLAFLQKKKKQALMLANQAVTATPTQSPLHLKAQLARVNALGWNDKFRQAFADLTTLDRQYPNNDAVLATRAMLSIWDKQYKTGSRLYKQALALNPSSFDANLGYADASRAQGNDLEALKYAYKTLDYHPNQRDAQEFIRTIKLAHQPSVTAHTFVSSDNGHNVSVNYHVTGTFDPSYRLRLNTGFRQRLVNNRKEAGQATIRTCFGGFQWRYNPAWQLTGTVGVNTLQAEGKQNNHLYTNLISEFKVDRFQIVDVRYNRDVQTFTAGLVGRNITMNTLIGTYNLATPFRLGLYSQYVRTYYSDQNLQQSLFASIYYNISHSPVVKAGINYQTMSFRFQVPRLYFSPLQFTSVEAFGQFENIMVPESKLLYQISLAGGMQRIESDIFRPTYRLLFGLGWRPRRNVELLLYGQTSNIATSTAAGYSYSELGLKAKYIFVRQ